MMQIIDCENILPASLHATRAISRGVTPAIYGPDGKVEVSAVDALATGQTLPVVKANIAKLIADCADGGHSVKTTVLLDVESIGPAADEDDTIRLKMPRDRNVIRAWNILDLLMAATGRDWGYYWGPVPATGTVVARNPLGQASELDQLLYYSQYNARLRHSYNAACCYVSRDGVVPNTIEGWMVDRLWSAISALQCGKPILAYISAWVAGEIDGELVPIDTHRLVCRVVARCARLYLAANSARQFVIPTFWGAGQLDRNGDHVAVFAEEMSRA